MAGHNFILSLVRIVALIKKEFWSMVFDRNIRKILIMPIIIQSLLFGYGATFNFVHIPYIVLNNSQSPLSYDLLNYIRGGSFFILKTGCHDINCVQKAIDRQDGLIALVIEKDFDKGQSIKLEIITDARNSASANNALYNMRQLISSFMQKEGIKQPLVVESRFLFNENNYTRYTLLTGMIIGLSLIQVLMLSSFSVSREREDGTYDMMLMTPLNPLEILIGKAVAPICVAVFQALLLMGICLFYFKIPFAGSLGAIVVILALFAICFVGLGLAISTLCRTSQQSLIISFSLILPFIILSGMITPVDAMPDFFRYLAYCDPVYYSVMAVQRVYLQGQSLYDVLHLLISLCMLSIVTICTAMYFFRHKLE